jgi:hypothetical protein
MQLSSYGSELLVRRQLRCGVEQVLRGAGAAWSRCCGAAGGRVLAPSRATSRAASVGAWMTTDMKADGCDGGGDFGPGTLKRPAFAGVRRSKLARKRSWSSAERGVWRAASSWRAELLLGGAGGDFGESWLAAAGGAGRSCRGGRRFQKTTTTVGVS